MVGRFPICTYRSVWPDRVKWLTAFFALCLLPALAGAQVHFADVTASAGIDFHHLHGGTGAKYPMETMGSGAVLFDYDGDGWLDLYFVNSAGPGVLYRNSADGTFPLSPAQLELRMPATAWAALPPTTMRMATSTSLLPRMAPIPSFATRVTAVLPTPPRKRGSPVRGSPIPG